MRLPVPLFIVPWNDDARTLMLRAMTFCVPEVALRCWIAVSTVQGETMPRDAAAPDVGGLFGGDRATGAWLAVGTTNNMAWAGPAKSPTLAGRAPTPQVS